MNRQMRIHDYDKPIEYELWRTYWNEKDVGMLTGTFAGHWRCR
jgi:hypothetical protein